MKNLIFLVIVCLSTTSFAQNKLTKIQSGKIFKNVLYETNGEQVGLRNMKEEIILPCIYDEINFQNKYIEAVIDNKKGMFDYKGNKIVPCKFQTLIYDGKYIITRKNNKFGLYSLDGKELIECIYDEIGFERKNIKVKQNGHDLWFNKNGEQILM